MSQKITKINGNAITVEGSDVPQGQHAAFDEYREYMAALCEARLFWMAEAQKPTADHTLKFWFGSTMNHTILCYSLMESWFRGYWINRRELQSHAFGMSSRSFDRVLREATEGKYIALAAEDKDKRQKLVKPTRQTVLMFERSAYAYFKCLVENSHKLNTFTQGLRDRIVEIEAQDIIRRDDLNWSIFDEKYDVKNSQRPHDLK